MISGSDNKFETDVQQSWLMRRLMTGERMLAAFILAAASALVLAFSPAGSVEKWLLYAHIGLLAVVLTAAYVAFSENKSKLAALSQLVANLQKQESQCDRIVKNMFGQLPFAVKTITTDFRLVTINQEAERIFACNGQAAIGKKCFELHDRSMVCDGCPVLEAIATKKVCKHACVRTSNMNQLHLEYAAVPILARDQSVDRVVVLVLDMSNQVELRLQNEHLFMQTVTSLANLIGSRDHSTGTHSQRVQEIARIIGISAGLQADELEELSVAAILHDIGKIGIPEHILNKTGKLDEREYATIMKHPVLGHEAIQNIAPLRRVSTYVLHHHEAYDGSGYPSRLQGEQIPLISRILSIADVYEALTADRIYRVRLSEAQARAIMLEGRGTKFDPVLLDIFMQQLSLKRIPLRQSPTENATYAS